MSLHEMQLGWGGRRQIYEWRLGPPNDQKNGAGPPYGANLSEIVQQLISANRVTKNYKGRG